MPLLTADCRLLTAVPLSLVARVCIVAATCTMQLLFDVVSNDAVDGAPLEFPPLSFVDMVFLQDHVARVVRSGGVVAMNVIGDATNLAAITLKFMRVFGNVRILATDPNYYFISRVSPSRTADVDSVADVLTSARKAGLLRVCGDMLTTVLLKTDAMREEERLIGWLSPEEFLERLKTEAA